MSNTIESMLRPSGSKRWLRCSASASREAPIPDTPTADKDYGTAAHQVGAACLTTGNRAEVYLGELVEVDGDRTVRVDKDMVEGVQKYVDYVTGFCPTGTRLEVEAPVKLAPWLPNDGTADVSFLDARANELHIIDLKFGRGVKEYADHNPQLKCYGLGRFVELEDLGLVDMDTRVRLHIAQPRLEHFDEWATDAQTLLDFGSTLEAGVRSALGPNPPVHPGKHCKFCRARPHCAEAAQQAADAIGVQFDDLTKGEPLPTVAELMAPLEAMNPSQIDAADLVSKLAIAEVVEDWARSIFAFAVSAARQGLRLPGWKLVDGRGRRDWLDPDAVVAHAKKKRLAIDEFMPRDLASPAQIEKAIGKDKFSKLGFPLLLDKKPGAPTLVPESDKRQAIAVTPIADLFDDLTTDAAEEVDPFS